MARAFAAAGWSVEHARLYTDPTTGKLREIDLLVSRHCDNADVARADFRFVIECKRSREKPWVVFATRADIDSFFVPSTFAVGSLSENSLLTLIRDSLPHSDFLKPAESIGHGVTRAFIENREADPGAPYSALRGAVSASTALAEEFEEMRIRLGSYEGFNWPCITVPLVVVDAPLLRYAVDDAGLEKLDVVESAHVLTHHENSQDRLAVQIVTYEGLVAFLARTSWSVDALLKVVLERAALAISMQNKHVPVRPGPTA